MINGKIKTKTITALWNLDKQIKTQHISMSDGVKYSVLRRKIKQRRRLGKSEVGGDSTGISNKGKTNLFRIFMYYIKHINILVSINF